MGRLLTAGAEGGAAEVDGLTTTGTVRVRSNSPIRSGRFAYEFAATSRIEAILPSALSADDDKRFFRVWIHIEAMPSSWAQIVALMAGSATSILQLFVQPSGVVTASSGGGDPTATAMAPGWNLLEVSAEKLGAGDSPANGTSFQYRVNGGALVTKTSSLTGNVDRVRIGNQGGTTIDKLRADDIAINDMSGSDQTSWPSSTAGISCLLPTVNHASGLWEGPDGSTFPSDAWARLDNTPPKGVANSAANVNSQMLRNDSSSADSGMEMVMESPAEAGVADGAQVKVARGIGMIGAGSATAHTPGLTLTSGIVTAEEASVATSGTAGTFPTNWKRGVTPVASGSDLLNRLTAPRMKVAKKGATTSVLACCFIGVMIEADPKPAAILSPMRPIGIIGG